MSQNSWSLIGADHQVSASSPDKQFKRKYGDKLNQIELAEKRLSHMVKNGGGQVLSLPEYDKQVQSKLKDLAVGAESKTYEQNLDAKLEFINFQIGLLVSESAAIDLQAATEIKNAGVSKWQTLFVADADSVQGDGQAKIKCIDDHISNLVSAMQKNGAYYDYVQGQYVDIRVMSSDPKTGEAVLDETKTKSAIAQEKQYMQTARDSVVKSIQAADKLAEQHAKKVLEICKKSLSLPSLEKQQASDRSVERALDKASRKLAQLPDEMITQFQKLENQLFSLVYGFNDVLIDAGSSAGQMIDQLINQLTMLLDPVFSTATSLSLPVPKVVAPIKDLLAMAKQMGSEPAGLTPEQKARLEELKNMQKPPAIPQPWKDSVSQMVMTVMTIIQMFPVCLLSLVFSMIDAVVGQILALGGSMPPPLDKLPQALTLMPKLIQLCMTFPGSIQQIAMAKMQDMAAQVMALGTSIGSAIDGIMAPSPQCPEAVKAELQQKAEQEQKAKQEREQLAALEKQEKLQKQRQQQDQKTTEPRKTGSQTAKPADSLESREKRANDKLIAEFRKRATKIKANNTDILPS